MLASSAALLFAQESPQLDYPLSVAVSPNGALFLADRNLPGIWRVEEGKLSLYFQASKRFRTPLNAVRCVAFDRQGRLLAADTSSREVYRFDANGQPQPLIGNQVGIGVPMSLAVNQAGEIFVADLETHRIWKIPDAGGEPVEFAAVPAPRGLFIDAQDRLWAVCQAKDFQVVRYSPAGERETIVAGRPFQFPHNLLVDASDTCYVSDGYAKTIWRVAPGGAPEALVAGEPLVNPVGLAWEGEQLLVVDPRAQQKIFRVTTAGEISAVECGLARCDRSRRWQLYAQRGCPSNGRGSSCCSARHQWGFGPQARFWPGAQPEHRFAAHDPWASHRLKYWADGRDERSLFYFFTHGQWSHSTASHSHHYGDFGWNSRQHESSRHAWSRHAFRHSIPTGPSWEHWKLPNPSADDRNEQGPWSHYSYAMGSWPHHGSSFGREAPDHWPGHVEWPGRSDRWPTAHEPDFHWGEFGVP